MVVTLKSNAPAAIKTPDTTIGAADQFRIVLSAAKSAADASRMLVCACIAYLLNVNHYRDSKHKDYQSRKLACEFMKNQIAAQAGIKGGMLDIYVNSADDVYSAMIVGKSYRPVVSECAGLADPVKVMERLFRWMDAEQGIKSLTALRIKLGYSVGSSAPTGKKKGQKETATEKVNNLANAVASIEKLAADTKSGITAKDVHVKMAAAVSDPYDLAVQAFTRIATLPNPDIDRMEAVLKTLHRILDSLLAKRFIKMPKVTAAKPKAKGEVALASH